MVPLLNGASWSVIRRSTPVAVQSTSAPALLNNSSFNSYLPAARSSGRGYGPLEGGAPVRDAVSKYPVARSTCSLSTIHSGPAGGAAGRMRKRFGIGAAFGPDVGIGPIRSDG